MRTRGFEIVSKYEGKEVNVPKRATKHSAGYDIEASEDTILPSIWSTFFKHDKNASVKGITPVLVPTGI